MDEMKHTALTAMLESIAEQDAMIHTLDWRVIQAALRKAGDEIQRQESKLDESEKAVEMYSQEVRHYVLLHEAALSKLSGAVLHLQAAMDWADHKGSEADMKAAARWLADNATAPLEVL